MNAFLAGQGVNVTIAAADDAGNPIVASAASYRVIDQDGVEVVALTPIPSWDSSTTAFTFMVPAEVNTLPEGALQALRTVELHLTVEGAVAGTVVRSESYVIEASETLVCPVNSFQTYQQAILTGFSLVGLSRWSNAPRQQKVAALRQARNNLCQLRYRYLNDGQSYLNDQSFGVGDLSRYTKEQFDALPAEFREALARAQVIEADYLLMGDTDPEKLRSKGVASMVVGESSTAFRPGAGLNLPVCSAALKEVAKFVTWSVRIGRA